MPSIPLVDLKAQYAPLKEVLAGKFAEILGDMNLILGPELSAFEAEFASFCGAEHAVGVGSGLDALILALRACGIKQGDEVLVPAFSFVASASAVVLAGGVPRFVDIDPDTLLMDLNQIEQRLTPKTRALLPVHLYGQMVPMDELMAVAKAHGLLVVEDAAQAHGASYKGRLAGTWGDAGCFSFYPGKNLGAYGEGGAVISNSGHIAQQVRILRNQGSRSKYEHSEVGYNSRMDEIQAAVLRIKLPFLERWNAARRAWAVRYDEVVSSLGLVPVGTYHGTSARHLYVIRTQRRDAVVRGLHAQGIGAGIHYPNPLHRQPALTSFHDGTTLDTAELAAREVLSLPLFPELNDDQFRTVTGALERAIEESMVIAQ